MPFPKPGDVALVREWFDGTVTPWGTPRFICKTCQRLFDFNWPVQKERVAFTLALHIAAHPPPEPPTSEVYRTT